MSAVAKLKELGAAAVEEVLAPIVDQFEQKRRREAEDAAAAARADLARFPRTTKTIKEAEAKVGKAKADQARAEADLAIAKAKVSDAELEQYAAALAHGAELVRLRKAAIAPHVGAETLQQLSAAIEAYQASDDHQAAGEVLRKRLFKARMKLMAALEGAEDPPAEDLREWLTETLADAATLYADAKQRAVTARAHAHASDRAVRVLG